MQKKNLLAIALLKIKDKKSVRNIVMMTVAMSLLVPIIWLVLSFNLGLVQEIDKDNVNHILKIESSITENVFVKGDKSVQFFARRGKQLSMEEVSLFKSGEEINWQEWALKSTNDANIYLGIGEKSIQFNEDMTFKIIESESYIPSGIKDYIKNNHNQDVVVGQGFSNAKREIMVSKKFLNNIGVSSEQALGQDMFLEVDYIDHDTNKARFVIDNDTIIENDFVPTKSLLNCKIRVFDQYKIVGIISDEYYSLNEFTANDGDLWIKESSLMSTSGNLYPTISVQDVEYDEQNIMARIITYPIFGMENWNDVVYNEGCFLPVGGDIRFNFSGKSGELVRPIRYSFIQYKNFSQTKQMSDKFDNIVGNDGSGYRANTIQMAVIVEEYNINMIISSILGVIGVLSFVGVLVTYTNFIQFSIRKRKKFLTMLGNMGATYKECRRVLMLEMLGQVGCASIISTVISLVTCLIIKMSIFSHLKTFTTIQLSLIYLIPALAIVFLVIIFIVIILSFSTRKILKNTQ